LRYHHAAEHTGGDLRTDRQRERSRKTAAMQA
jgi:hypothetical protein